MSSRARSRCAAGRRSWQLRFEAGATRTLLTRREHTGPLLVQRPFYPESELPPAGAPTDSAFPIAPAQARAPCHVYLIHPPGGVVSGDELSLEVETGAAAHALLTTPAAGKFYRRGPAGARAGATAAAASTAECSSGCRRRTSSIPTPPWSSRPWRALPRVRASSAGRSAAWDCRPAPWICSRACCGFDSSSGTGSSRCCSSVSISSTRCLRHAGAWRAHAAFGTALAYPAGERELEHARTALAGADCADLTACLYAR